MYPVLFEVGSLSVYSYGFMIALGIIAGMSYLIIQGKKEVGLTFDQANKLFLYIFFAAIIGGKLFLFLEDPGAYVDHPERLFTGRGFVFYGSFLLAIPTMWWFFKANKLHPYRMLDVMAVTTCLVHMFGRIGCFLAGCCYGLPTDSALGVTFTDEACFAEPLNTPLFPTQLFEAFYIFLVMIVLLTFKNKRTFYGQLFLGYLIMYAIGRSILEIYRGDSARGFVIDEYLSHSQFIAFIVLLAVVWVYIRWSKRLIQPRS
jgi:phosphatidylglycerol---prolipoprotein diacylglyceryl transferase